jgi:hypothetical protein
MRTAFLSLALLHLITAVVSAQAAQPPQRPADATSNVAEEQQRPAGKSDPVLVNTLEIFQADKYPRLALEREVEGQVKVRVEVDPSGLATHCQTLGSPPPELGGPTCALILAEGRFEPARDRRGRAVKGRLERSVRWVLEALEPQPFEEGSDRLVFSFDDEAVITDCKRERQVSKRVLEDEARMVEHLGEPLPDPCKIIGLGAKVVAAASGLTPLSEWLLKTETLVRTGEAELWRSIGNGPDEKMLMASGFRLEIGADGKVSRCAPIAPEQDYLPDQPMNCDDLSKQTYVASSEPKRVLHIVNLTYFKRRKTSEATS